VPSALRSVALVLAALLPVVSCASGNDPSAGATPPAGAGVSFRHDAGETVLPAPAARIVTTADETTELVVALGLQPVGAGSTRVDGTGGTGGTAPFAGYYLPADRLGNPAFVGGEQPNLEAIAALQPDLVLHGGADDVVDDLARIAPTAVFDVQEPGAWQRALQQLGVATGRTARADEIVAGHRTLLAESRAALAPVAARYPRLSVLYPQYRGGTDNYLFDERFALAAAVPDLGFTLAGSSAAQEQFPGVLQLSTELYPTIEGDAVLALGTVPWRTTAGSDLLEALDAPVVGIQLDPGQPSAGPITSPALVVRYRDALLTQLG
jgi:iron complex transport system substrate-binding protein